MPSWHDVHAIGGTDAEAPGEVLALARGDRDDAVGEPRQRSLDDADQPVADRAEIAFEHVTVEGVDETGPAVGW
jgi:hypothetical protein